MKIGPLTEALRFLNIVRERKEGDLPDQGSGGGRQRNPRDGSKGSDDPEASRAKVQDAVVAFSTDSQALANGLTADLVTGDVGLSVLLRDRQGKVLRQLTGDEFLRMREAAGPESRARGKILDQKL